LGLDRLLEQRIGRAVSEACGPLMERIEKLTANMEAIVRAGGS
jgi:hypothetical protein